jgi:hypothetical protein
MNVHVWYHSYKKYKGLCISNFLQGALISNLNKIFLKLSQASSPYVCVCIYIYIHTHTHTWRTDNNAYNLNANFIFDSSLHYTTLHTIAFKWNGVPKCITSTTPWSTSNFKSIHFCNYVCFCYNRNYYCLPPPPLLLLLLLLLLPS